MPPAAPAQNRAAGPLEPLGTTTSTCGRCRWSSFPSSCLFPVPDTCELLGAAPQSLLRCATLSLGSIPRLPVPFDRKWSPKRDGTQGTFFKLNHLASTSPERPAAVKRFSINDLAVPLHNGLFAARSPVRVCGKPDPPYRHFNEPTASFSAQKASRIQTVHAIYSPFIRPSREFVR